MTLVGIAQETIERMRKEGKVITLSKEKSYEIDHKLAMELKPIKEEFYKKERASRHYIAQQESRYSTE